MEKLIYMNVLLLFVLLLTACHHPGNMRLVTASPLVFVEPLAGVQAGQGVIVYDPRDPDNHYMVTCDHVAGFTGVAITNHGLFFRGTLPKTAAGWGWPFIHPKDIDVSVMKLNYKHPHASPLSFWEDDKIYHYLGRTAKSKSINYFRGNLQGWAILGDSGSPVRNSKGEVVGIISAIGLNGVMCMKANAIRFLIQDKYLKFNKH